MLYQETQQNQIGQALVKDERISGNSRVPTLLGVLGVLVAALLYVFLLRPFAEDVSLAKTDVAAKSGQIEQMKQQVASYKAAEEKLDLTSQVKKFEILKAVPAAVDQDEVIRDLIGIANSYDITLHSISFSKGVSSQKGVGSLRINASFEGNYSDLTSFLEGIERNSRLFKISSISVQLNSLDVLNSQRATFSLSMDSFYSLSN